MYVLRLFVLVTERVVKQLLNFIEPNYWQVLRSGEEWRGVERSATEQLVVGKVKERDALKDLSVDGRVIIKYTLQKQNGEL
jgi:hypothetical protein